MNEEFIFKEGNKYIIKRCFNNIEYEFDICNSIIEANDKIEQLNKDGWPIKTKMIKNNDLKKEFLKKNEDKYEFGFKIGKAYKHGFLVLTRTETYDLLPKLPYEEECDIFVDKIHSKARLNFVPRIIIDKKNQQLIKYLKELNKIDPDQRRTVTLIKKDNKNEEKINNKDLIEENKKLKEKIRELTYKIEELYTFSKKNL